MGIAAAAGHFADIKKAACFSDRLPFKTNSTNCNQQMTARPPDFIPQATTS